MNKHSRFVCWGSRCVSNLFASSLLMICRNQQRCLGIFIWCRPNINCVQLRRRVWHHVYAVIVNIFWSIQLWQVDIHCASEKSSPLLDTLSVLTLGFRLIFSCLHYNYALLCNMGSAVLPSSISVLPVFRLFSVYLWNRLGKEFHNGWKLI